MSDPSGTNSLDGSTTPHGFTARGRTPLGGGQLETNSYQAISPPVTGQPGTSQPGTGQDLTGQPVTSHPVTGQPGYHQPSIHRSTRHRSTRHQSLVTTSHQARVNISPVNHRSSQPRWLSWMRRPTGDKEVAGSTPAEVGNILLWRLIMKYFLRSFSPFR